MSVAELTGDVGAEEIRSRPEAAIKRELLGILGFFGEVLFLGYMLSLRYMLALQVLIFILATFGLILPLGLHFFCALLFPLQLVLFTAI